MRAAPPGPDEGLWHEGIRAPIQLWERHAKVTVESVDLEGDYPETNLVVVFHRMERPECRYAWRNPIWIDGTLNPEPAMGDPGDIWVPFVELLDLNFRPAAVALPCSTEPVAVNATSW